MTFLLFNENTINDKKVLRSTGDKFSGRKQSPLASLDKPWQAIKAGWHVDASELLKMHFDGAPPAGRIKLVIDFHPTSKYRVGLVELTEVYAFTWDEAGSASWTPFMLKLNDVFYEEYEEAFDNEWKVNLLSAVPYMDSNIETIEFLYLNGDSQNWKGGRNGMTNAAFLHGGARDYFRQFF